MKILSSQCGIVYNVFKKFVNDASLCNYVAQYETIFTKSTNLNQKGMHAFVADIEA
jgi:hypothetical protein